MTTVVLVDDQAMIRAGLRGILADAGITVLAEAVDGRDGIAVVRRVRPDVVLMDLRMPVLDGVAAIVQLRGDPGLAGVRILVLTTFDADPTWSMRCRRGPTGSWRRAPNPTTSSLPSSCSPPGSATWCAARRPGTTTCASPGTSSSHLSP